MMKLLEVFVDKDLLENLTDTPISIFQPYIFQDEKKIIEDQYIPFDHSLNPLPDLREYYLFQKIYETLPDIKSKYIGLFSNKFGRKTYLTGGDVKKFILDNDGYDVYLFNPYPYEDDIFYNIWSHGEYYHPGIFELAQNALQSIYPNLNLHDLNRCREKAIFCNFWVGSKTFWHEYINFLKPIANLMQLKKEYFSSTTYERGPTPYFPFIIERLLTFYLVMNAKWKVKSYIYPNFMIEKLMMSEFHWQMYRAMSPFVKTQDEKYGSIWPQSVRDELDHLRVEVVLELDRKCVSKILRV